MEILLTILIFVILIIAMLSYSSLSWGWVLFKFWGWFVLPVFTDLPQLYYWNAVGLMFVIGLFNRPTSTIKDEYLDGNKGVALILLGPWLSLTLGWIIKSIWM